VRIAIAVLACTQLMNLLFIFGLHIGVGGLALSIGLGATLNAAWLLIGLVRLGVYKPQPGWFGFLARALLATLLLGACLVWADRSIDWLDRAHPLLRALKMAGVLGGVAALYVAVLSMMGIKLGQFVRKA
jgi:putative peptidoglycan lipid II flippase